MSSLSSFVRAQLELPERRKFIKYTMVSLVSVVVTEVILFVAAEFLGQSGGWAGFEASIIAAVPSYYLNRMWVWGKSGRSHFMKEVVPFWVLAFIGIGFSAVVGIIAEDVSKHLTKSTSLQHVWWVIANVGAFAILWFIKYVIFNKLLFVNKPEVLEDEPALDGRTGFPG